MSAEVLVKVENVSKKFCRTLKRSLWYGVQDVFGEMLGRQGEHEGLRTGEFWAVSDVSFELRRGECLGLIGRNGAGKTTLLKMMNGLIKPDCGRIEMHGRVGSIIALGAGFNPILTGRENIYVNGSVLGLSKKEIDNKLDEIIEFSELEEFIDSPVQNYSSGMQVRLGFSIATALKPDIILLDEVLAVGDLSFRHKCFQRIDLLRACSAVVFVSHSVEQVGRICSNTLLLHEGRCAHYGNVQEGLEAYQREQPSKQLENSQSFVPPICSANVRLAQSLIQAGGGLDVFLDIQSSRSFSVNVRLTFFHLQSQIVAGTAESSFEKINPIEMRVGSNHYCASMQHIYLRPGSYVVAVSLISFPDGDLIFAQRGDLVIQVQGTCYGESHYLSSVNVSSV